MPRRFTKREPAPARNAVLGDNFPAGALITAVGFARAERSIEPSCGIPM